MEKTPNIHGLSIFCEDLELGPSFNYSTSVHDLSRQLFVQFKHLSIFIKFTA